MRPVELERFLSEIEAQMTDLPAPRRIEILDETRSHLEAMLAANRADGLDEAAAWEKARRDFGEAQRIGRDLAGEWQRAPRIETVGTPLTRREKLILWARPLLGIGIIHQILAFEATDKLFEFLWAHGVFAGLSFGGAALYFLGWRRGGGRWTPATVFHWTVCWASLGWVNFYFLFDAQTGKTAWDVARVNLISGLLIFGVIAALLLNRRKKSPFPWRQTPLGRQNPIAAEERHRLGPRIGLAMGLCVSWMDELQKALNFHEFQKAALNCALLFGIFLFWRWPFGKLS